MNGKPTTEISTGLQVIGVILMLIVGYVVAGWLARAADRACVRSRRIHPGLRSVRGGRIGSRGRAWANSIDHHLRISRFRADAKTPRPAAKGVENT